LVATVLAAVVLILVVVVAAATVLILVVVLAAATMMTAMVMPLLLAIPSYHWLKLQLN
jgi:hypothetical protein